MRVIIKKEGLILGEKEVFIVIKVHFLMIHQINPKEKDQMSTTTDLSIIFKYNYLK